MPKFDQYNHKTLTGIVICWINGMVVDGFDRSSQWYVEGKVLQSGTGHVIVMENGHQVHYDISFRKRRGITNRPASLFNFEKHARTIPGAKYINYYFADTRTYSHRKYL